MPRVLILAPETLVVFVRLLVFTRKTGLAEVSAITATAQFKSASLFVKSGLICK
jgi:hypothetical protein